MPKVVPWKNRKFVREKYPTVLPLSKKQIEVLKGLAKKGPTNAYQIAAETGKAYSFVFNNLKEFEKRRLVTIIKKEDTKKGTRATIYDLTLDGVLLVLKNSFYLPGDLKKNRNFFYKIIDSYRSMLPLVFGKYDYFKKMELDRLYRIRLDFIVNSSPTSFRKVTGVYPWLEREEQITRYFYFFDFYRLDNHFIKDFDPRTWLNALKQDVEIREYVLEELRKEQNRLKNIEKTIVAVSNFLKKTEV